MTAPRPNRECEICASAFYASPGHIAKGWGRFCSITCRSVAKSGSGNPRWTGIAGECVCASCGRAFRRRPGHRAKWKDFCSDECRNAGFPEKPMVRCAQCKKPFMSYACWERRANGKDRFCSRACTSANKDRKVEFACVVCGKKFKIKRSVVLRAQPGTGSFCGAECKARRASSSPLTISGKLRGAKGGKRTDLGFYVRSSWEANYARFLIWVAASGHIKGWEYEPETFEFPVKRGSKFYTPDFRVTRPDGTQYFVEVKGYMSPQSATKLKRMKKYFPDVEIELVDGPAYRQLAKAVSGMISGWERAA